MNPKPYNRSPSLFLRVLPIVLAISVGAAGLFALLVAAGFVELPWIRKVAVADKPKAKPEGVAVVLSARFIPAYTKITRDHVLDDKTGDFVVAYVRPEDAAREGFLPFDRILGRVLKEDKTAKHAFTEKDFLPEGTHSGLAAGIPPTKRALVIPVERIGGIYGLKLGDHVDVLVSMPIEPHLSQAGNRSGQTPGLTARGGHAGSSGQLRSAGVLVIAQDGIVVMPVTTRMAPVPGAVTGRDGKFPTHPVQEITLAVDPIEATAIMQALSVDTEIFCVMRSGQPGETPGQTPNLLPPPPPMQIEVVVGHRRETITYSSSGTSAPLSAPVPPMQKVASNEIKSESKPQP